MVKWIRPNYYPGHVCLRSVPSPNHEKHVHSFIHLWARNCDLYSPNFFGFPKDGFPFVLLADIKQVRIQLFVIMIHLEERTSVRINQVLCIYLKHKTAHITAHDIFSQHTTTLPSHIYIQTCISTKPRQLFRQYLGIFRILELTVTFPTWLINKSFSSLCSWNGNVEKMNKYIK